MSRSKKKPYTKSKRFDTSCRSHGGCPWCEGNHDHTNRQRILSAKEQIVEAAVRWGEKPADLETYRDRVEDLAADLELSLALSELEDAQANVPTRFPIKRDTKSQVLP